MPVSILWGSPLPPVRSGVSAYATEMLQHLGRLARVRVLRPPGWSRDESCFPGDELDLVDAGEPADEGEHVLVHLGNNPYHEWLLPRLDEGGAVVVLHDLVLHHLLVEATLARGSWELYERRLVAGQGDAGRVLARARRHGLSGLRDPFLFPSRRAFLAGQRAVLVHSRWAEEQVRGELAGVPVRAIPLPVADPGAVDRARARRSLGIGDGELVVMHLGFLTREKGLEEILGGVAAAAACGAPVRLVTVGEGGRSGHLGEAAGRAGVTDRVTALGWVDDERLPRLPAAADLGVVLRTPSAGETSAAALRFLACGTPVAVGGLRQFLEWPEAAAPRLTPGPAAAPELARWILRAAAERDRGEWDRRRRAARRTYAERHRPEHAAAELVRVLEALA